MKDTNPFLGESSLVESFRRGCEGSGVKERGLGEGTRRNCPPRHPALPTCTPELWREYVVVGQNEDRSSVQDRVFDGMSRSENEAGRSSSKIHRYQDRRFPLGSDTQGSCRDRLKLDVPAFSAYPLVPSNHNPKLCNHSRASSLVFMVPSPCLH